MSYTERDIVLISKGNELAFEGFMREHSEKLYYHAYGIIGNKESAEEVVSDVFVEVWKRRKMLLEIENIGAWLGTIVYNKSVSLLRKEMKKKQELNIDDFPNFEFPHLITPVDSIISAEEVNMLHEAMEKLPVKCKRIFYMAKIDQMPYSEICKQTGITLATVNYHIAYAMDMLKKKLRNFNLRSENGEVRIEKMIGGR